MSKRRALAEWRERLHAGVVAAADQRAKLERLCRYITRPAFSTERLSLTAHGLIHY